MKTCTSVYQWYNPIDSSEKKKEKRDKEVKEEKKEVKKEVDDEGFISPSAPDATKTNLEVKQVWKVAWQYYNLPGC